MNIDTKYDIGDNVLFDGYTAYLVYRMFDIEKIPVVIWPNDLLKSKEVRKNVKRLKEMNK